MSLYSNIQVGKPKNSEVEITGEIPVEVVAENRKDVLREMRAARAAQLDGVKGQRRARADLHVDERCRHDYF